MKYLYKIPRVVQPTAVQACWKPSSRSNRERCAAFFRFSRVLLFDPSAELRCAAAVHIDHGERLVVLTAAVSLTKGHLRRAGRLVCTGIEREGTALKRIGDDDLGGYGGIPPPGIFCSIVERPKHYNVWHGPSPSKAYSHHR